MHLLLALASAAAVALVGLEGTVRAVRSAPPGRWTSRLYSIVVIALMVTMAWGLGLVVRGARPQGGWLHVMYAVLALGGVAISDSVAARSGPRARGAATAGVSLVVLVLIFRLFGTG